MCNLHLPTEESLFRVIVAMLQFSIFSQNPAEQVNIVIARKKDNIYKHIRRPEEGLECLKPCLIFYTIISTDLLIYITPPRKPCLKTYIHVFQSQS